LNSASNSLYDAIMQEIISYLKPHFASFATRSRGVRQYTILERTFRAPPIERVEMAAAIKREAPSGESVSGWNY